MGIKWGDRGPDFFISYVSDSKVPLKNSSVINQSFQAPRQVIFSPNNWCHSLWFFISDANSDINIWVSRENYGERFFLFSYAELWTWTQDTYHLQLSLHCMLYKVPSNYKRILLLPVEFITKYFKEVFDPWNRDNLILRLQILGPLQDYFL